MQRRFQKIPEPIASFIRAVNDRDRNGFLATFANDAVVRDVEQEFRGLDAIKEWSDREIFDVNVTLQIVDLIERDDQTVVTFGVDGTFDKTGLPHPLLINHHFTLRGDKIAQFSSQLAES
jgi:ketosteroid isomerase-like protein